MYTWGGMREKKGNCGKIKAIDVRGGYIQLEKKGGKINMENMSCHHGLAQYNRNIRYQGQTLGYK